MKRMTYYSRAGITLYCGDSLEVAPELDAESVSAVVTDPPYGLGFMGKAWDKSVPGVPFWTAFMHAMKPGAHLLAFGGSRTYHRMGVAIEDAGLELRDTLMWLYGSGFPKSHDVSKAIDKANGRYAVDLAPFGEYVRERRKAKGLTLGQLDDLMDTNTAASWWEGRKSGVQLPGRDTYNRLKSVLDMDDRFDALIEWEEARREVIGIDTKARSTSGKSALPTMGGKTVYESWDITAPATDAAREWQGWGTALKPAHEPIILARKPLCGTVASNVLAHGTGALNIDACRIGGNTWVDEDNLCSSCAEAAGKKPKPTTLATRVFTAPSSAAPTTSARGESSHVGTSKTDTGCSAGQFPAGRKTSRTGDSSLNTAASGKIATVPFQTDTSCITSTTTDSTIASKTCNSCGAPITSPTTKRAGQSDGRWPSNVILDEAAAAALDAQSGELASNSGKPFRRNADKLRNAYGAFAGAPAERGFYGDTGGASRFFYCAKASRKERNAGLDGMPERKHMAHDNPARAFNKRDGGKGDEESYKPQANHHPTVKPLALMRYLITLITPPGGIVLDPFAGSGSTLVACAQLGFPAIGIELSEEYCEIIARRVDHALNERPAVVQPSLLEMVAD